MFITDIQDDRNIFTIENKIRINITINVRDNIGWFVGDEIDIGLQKIE